MATQTKTAPKLPTLAQMVDISKAHDAGDEGFALRAKTVTVAIAAGVDVKTLAQTMATEAAKPGSDVVAVGQSVLGYAKAAHDILVAVGVTPVYTEAAHVKAIADTYRAVMRHGSTVAKRDIVKAGIGGKTPAAKIERTTKAARAMVKAAKAARKTAAPKPRVSTPAGVNAHVVAIKAITGGIARGQITVTPDILSAIAALTEAANAKAPKATPAPVPSPATVAKAAA